MAKQTTIRHFGKVVNGKRIYYNRELHDEYVYALEGQEFEEVIKVKFRKVSTDAHGYYRGGILGECLNYEMFRGWDKEMLHNFFSDKFLKYTKNYTITHDNGQVEDISITRIESTSALSSREMAEFIENVIVWLAEQGVVIHSPEQYLLDKYKA